MTEKTESPKIRIKELRHVKASELIPDPANWRLHPDAQREAVGKLLESVGYVDALIARENPDGTLALVDGHLRAEISAEDIVPVLITDLTEEEAKVVLATLDVSSEMASTDFEALQKLVGEIPEQSAVMQAMLESRAKDPDFWQPELSVETQETPPAEAEGGTAPFAVIRVRCAEKDGEAIFSIVKGALDDFEAVSFAMSTEEGKDEKDDT